MRANVSCMHSTHENGRGDLTNGAKIVSMNYDYSSNIRPRFLRGTRES